MDNFNVQEEWEESNVGDKPRIKSHMYKLGQLAYRNPRSKIMGDRKTIATSPILLIPTQCVVGAPS